MKINELEELAKEGKLTVEKSSPRKQHRRQYIYDKNEPMYIDGVFNEKSIEIKEVRKIDFISYRYSARTENMDEHQAYKITHKDFDNLKKLGAKDISK